MRIVLGRRPGGRVTGQHRNVLCVAGTFPIRLPPSPVRTSPPRRVHEPPVPPPSSSIPPIPPYPSAALLGSHTTFPLPSMRMLSNTQDLPCWAPQVAQDGRRSEILTRYPGPPCPMAQLSYQREDSSVRMMVARDPRVNWPCIFPITNR